MLNENLPNEVNEETDLDFVSGGAKIDKNISKEFEPTFNTQPCNCGMFEPSICKSSVHICDNCKWSRAPEENTNMTYCLKQSCKS